jgi:crotonobetainyl-CoA:carnitine CoA-transferase CaiB-like acyl-CoA transferase
LELATGVSGGYVGKLLAAYGADVVKVEPPGGDPVRRHGPFPDGAEDDLVQGALHLHLGVGKRSAVADLTSPEGRALLCDLVPTVDVVLESFPPGWLAGQGLGAERLEELRPGLVVVSITPFGQDGPYAELPADDIVLYAIGGPMHATGSPEREPVKLAGNQIQYQCGNVAAVATLGALTVAERTGRGVQVDVSNLETQVGSIDRRTTYLLYHGFTGRIATRPGGGTQSATPAGMFPSSDGYVQILTIPSWVPRMVEALGDDDLAKRYTEPGWMTDPDLPDAVDAVLYPWLAERTKAEASRDGQAHRWPVTPLTAPVELLDDPHFAARGFWVEPDEAHPVAGRFRQPGQPFRLSGLGDGARLRRPAPLLGQHQQEVRVEAQAIGRQARRESGPASTAKLPLEGVRVLDLTVVWAGPYATMLLADLGAEVIRVENPWVFPTATRGGLPRPPRELVPEHGPLGSYPDDDPGMRPWNRHSMFSAHARGKRSCTLDLRQPLGLELFLRLVDRADVLVENNSVRVLDQLGLGWEALHARNPRLVMVRLPPMGLSGPYRDWLGFGAHFEALCGMTAIRGYRDADPTELHPVFHMDPATGAAGAFATLVALRRREQTGEGDLVELAQSENMLQHIGEYLVDAARTGRTHRPLGNRHVTWAPQGCYPCLGTPPEGPTLDEPGRWVVLSVRSDEEWAGLVRAMGSPEWAADERFAAAAGRRAHHDELDERLSAWTRALDRHEVFERCRAEGVPSGPVLDEADCLADPHLAARGFFRENGSADLGTYRFPGHLWRWTGPDLRWEPLSCLGTDNEYVYREVLGVSDQEWAALDAGGHLSLDYLRPDGTPF